MSPLDAAQFRKVCGRFATGVAIAAVSDEQGNPQGLTVNSFVSISLEPPIVLFSIDREASLRETFLKANAFGISILKEEHRWLSDRFAYEADDRFTGVSWTPGKWGSPLLDGALATLECTLDRCIDAGDHTLVLGEVRAAEVSDEGLPLLYFASGYRHLARE
jgi:flavin reductase (DIM6/NTAB) family NADH-FMN oxidoreductase RutF